MLKIGLTGGIGSGKTAVSNLFAKKNVPVIDADTISHRLVEPSNPAFAEIVSHFGYGIIGPDKKLDRKQLRQIIFENPIQKIKLESVLHPRVFEEINLRLAELSAHYCIISIPLLFESTHKYPVDRVLVVDCPVQLQVSRVRSRDNMTEFEVRRIIESQSSRNLKLDAADDIVTNDGSQRKLSEQVNKLHRFYLSLNSTRLNNG